MSATASTDREFEAGAVAFVTFRVRCEKFGIGDEVVLVSTDGKQVRQQSVVCNCTRVCGLVFWLVMYCCSSMWTFIGAGRIGTNAFQYDV
jgi:hypothetical protein